MKLNKTLALAALVVSGLFVGNIATQAQDATTNTPPAAVKPGKNLRGSYTDALAKRLALTDDQKPKVKTALDELQQKQHALRTDTTLSAEDKKAKLKELFDSTNAKLKEILTPEQYTKWEKNGPGHRRPLPTPASDATNAPAAAK